ncbi:unnamed protein product [Somion occarium]|uniref:Cell morphogenesis protein PAG1 n=1 Tax=Somion occarium TaxID=3059160 RepID=A0ABP1DPK3_9APHY
MGSEGIQITIPDFDDDDFNSTPLFGRPQGASIWGTSAGSGSESPTILTPVVERNERSYFHSRGDSVASEDSSHSIQLTGKKIRSPFAHSAQSSVATTTSGSPFSKKGSFASLRNAFKSSKSNEAAPPLPPLDQQAYPALKNPFNRSTSSLAHVSRPSTHTSPPQFRPSTPASNDSRTRRTPSRSRGHSSARSQHSYSGSIFHFSDGGSDHGHGFSLSSPPPVPPVPHSFGQYPVIESDSIPEMEEQVVMDARTPSDFALHAIFIRFAASAESLITEFIAQPYDHEPLLDAFMGPGVDIHFDGLLDSLGKIAQKHAKSVVESVMRWRRSQVDGSDLQRSQYSVKAVRTLDSTAVVAERKMLTSTYIMCRALVTATKGNSKDSLGEAVGNSLEDMTFEQFRRPDHKTLTQSVNHRAIADLYAVLLGNLAEIRFESVTDRFLRELGPIAEGQIPKDSDFKFETLVKGLRYVQIKVWPPERFEEGAEFFESLSKSFGNAHGIRLKSIFAETLVHMLHPIAKTAQAEVNHPDWAKAIEMVYPKAKDMMSKPRYWHAAYPLAVTSLCVAPTEFFLRNWMSCFEAGLSKMKERPYRMTVLNGMMRLVWTYLYRCHEPASTASSKLESLVKHFFPPNRHTVIPQEERLEPFIYIIHFILSRHVDLGSEICLDLLQARIVASPQTNATINLAPERMAIATQAILLTLHLFEREESVPSWPCSADFASVPSTSEYPTSSDLLSSPLSRHGVQDLLEQSKAIQRFQTETRALSNAAVGAMASLIHKAFFPPDVTASPVDKLNAEQYEPMKASPTLERITAILASFQDNLQACGKKALRSLLVHATYDDVFAEEALRRAFVTTRDLSTSNARFFEVLSEVVCNAEHGFNFSQVVCLGLSNLCHPLVEIRYRAFNMLETIHEQASGILSMVQYEAAVGSSAPSTYLHAHRLISDVLSGEHPDQALNVLAQFAGWIPQVFENRGDQGALILLQSLEFWVPCIDLMAENKSRLSREGRSAIYHLVALTLRYAETHAEQIFVLWTRLVDAPYQSNGHAVVRFLLEESNKVGSAIFASCAAKIVACLSQSVVGRELFVELCSVIEPARMPVNMEHRLVLPDAEELEMWSDLDILFSDQPRLPLGVAPFSLLFLAETSLERYWDFQEQLPVLLHCIFMHLDHRQAFVQERTRHLLFQMLRSCVPGYDELPDRLLYPARSELRRAIAELQKEVKGNLWKEDDPNSRTVPRMRWLCSRILEVMEPLCPTISEEWGALALKWAVECPMRSIAFRSLQLFRALMPKWKRHDVAQLLGRLSITIADTDVNLNKFNVEVLMTLTAMASSEELETALPQMFWGAVGCLSTTAEEEFQAVLRLLDTLLDRIDLDDPQTADLLVSQRPPDWQGSVTLQSSLLTGLRSSSTVGATLELLQHLAKVGDARLIDPTEGRVRDLYTLSLPWCLHAMYTESSDEALQEFAINIGHLAEEEERPSLTRIMTSFAKGRFRTKDDFLRQSVAALREHYGAEHWTEVMTLLMGLVLNNERWLRVRTMQILKVLFQQRETRAPVDFLGSELLMPLLRLLETDLATEALDVLEEPLKISGGPSARHVLRMSMHHRLAADTKEVESVAEVFGIAEETGWCVPRAAVLRAVCRSNLRAVFDSCKVHSRPSRINFQPDEIPTLAQDSSDNLGELVQNLHELSSFFQEQRSSNSIPSKQLEARVAAILAKSTDDVPQTPLVDIFDIGSLTPYQDTDSASGSDTESDLFEFDSPQIAQSPNGFHRTH